MEAAPAPRYGPCMKTVNPALPVGDLLREWRQRRRMSQLLGLPELLLRASGAVLLPFAALLAYLALREQVNRMAVWAVVIGNGLWAADSLLLLLSGWVAPTPAGYAFVIAQALAVLMYAEFQYVGLRRSERAVAA